MKPIRSAATLAAFLVSLSWGQAASAVTYYVDPVNGNDGGAGTSTATAKQTIAGVGPLVNPGDTVYLRANGSVTGHYLSTTQTYRTCVFDEANWSGTSGNLVTVETYPPDLAAGNPAIFDNGYAEFKIAPNSAWVPCTEPGAHPDEYISVNTYSVSSGAEFVSGCFLQANGQSGDRLLSYSRLEHLRATQESQPMGNVPISDPRPGWPLWGNTNYKNLWAYRGPGIWWDPTTQKIHFRASATHWNQPGVIDYSGETDPRQLSLSIALNPLLPVRSSADYITFKNIVVQNGGEQTASIAGDGDTENYAQRVTFDHCTFNVARNGVATGTTQYLTFTNCVFDGNRPSYVCREDIKAAPLIVESDGSQGTDGGCRITQAKLLQGQGVNDDMEIAYCEFRNGHDGVYPKSGTKIHHCLFENNNDEGVCMFLPTDLAVPAEIHDNLFRQSMNAWSLVECAPQNSGYFYVYRNVMDNRVPVLGFRSFPQPSLGFYDPVNTWRAGGDFKIGTAESLPGYYCYQNTIICGDYDDNVISQCWSGTGNEGRYFRNNLLVGMQRDKPFYAVPDMASHTVDSQGNTFYRRIAVAVTPMFDGTPTDYATLLDLQNTFPSWEVGSDVLNSNDPLFQDVPDYNAADGGTLRNADYRLKDGSPAIGSGVDLSGTGWPGTEGSPAAPDVGAFAYGAGPMAIGVDGRFVFPNGATPAAEAGDYSVVTDAGDDGFETVTLDGTGSSDPDGSISSYNWTLNGYTICSASTGSVSLPVGTHQIYLTVTDDSSNTATDMRQIVVAGYDNIVRNPGFESGATSWILNTGCSIATAPVHSGGQSLQLAGAAGERSSYQDVPITPSAALTVSGWIKTTSNGSSHYARYKVDWLNSTGGVISSQLVGAVVAPNTDWTFRTQGMTPPSNAFTARLKVTLDAGSVGNAYLDDTHLLIANKIGNPHFEKGLTDWTIPSSSTELTTANARSGVYAIAVTNPSTTLYVDSARVAASPSTAYTISAWAKGVNVSSVGNKLYVYWYNSTGGQIGGKVLVGTWPTGTFDYTQKVAKKTSPAGTASMKVTFQCPAGTGECYFDDVWVK